MLKRFVDIRDSLLEVSEHEHGEMVVDSSPRLVTRCRKYVKMLTELDVVVKSLQTRGHSLQKCRGDLNVLIDTVRQE